MDVGEIASAFVTIRPKTDASQFESEARSGILPSIGRIATDAASLWAAKKIFDFGKAGFDELEQAQKVSTQTDVILKNLGASAGVTKGEVDGLSEAMLKQSGVDDEVAKSAENILLRLGVTGPAFKEATQASNDLAVAMGTDMTSAAELLGKALAHPEMAARLLKPAIGGLTAEQLDSIKAFQAQGDAAGAQGVILDAVNAKVAGSAEAYGKTLPGSLAIAQESWKNAKAEVVGGFAPAIELGATVSTKFADELQKLPGPATDVLGAVVLLGGGVASLVRPVSDAVNLFSRWKAAHDAATAATEASTAATEAGTIAETEQVAVTETRVALDSAAAVAAAQRVVSNEGVSFSDAQVAAAMQARQTAEMQALVGNDALIASDAELAAAEAEVAAAAEAEAAALLDAEGATVASGAAFGPWGAAVAAGILAASAAIDIWGGKTQYELAQVTSLAQASGKDLVESFDFTKNEGNPGDFAKQLDLLVHSGTEGIGVLQRYRTELIAEGRDTADVDAALQRAADAQTNMTATQQAGTQATDEAAAAVANLSQLESDLASAMDKTYQSMLEPTKLNVNYQASIDDLTSSLKKNHFTLDEGTDKGRANIDVTLKAGEAIAKLIEQKFNETHSIQAATDAGAMYVAGLHDQLRQAGYTEDQVAQLISTMHLTPDEIRTTFSTNAVEQQIIVGKYLATIKNIPADQQTVIEAEINQGQFDLVNQQLDDIAHGRTVFYSAQFEQSFPSSGGVTHRAAGGPVGANEPFRGAEEGFEILVHDGMYRSPAGGTVLSHADSMRALTSGDSGGAPDRVTVNLALNLPNYLGDRVELGRAMLDAAQSAPFTNAVAESLRRRERGLRR